MIDCGYRAPGTKAADFRKLMPLVLMSALRQAGTVVCEPMHRYHLEIPAERSPPLQALARLTGGAADDRRSAGRCARDGR